jgi:hypothetical protein
LLPEPEFVLRFMLERLLLLPEELLRLFELLFTLERLLFE